MQTRMRVRRLQVVGWGPAVGYTDIVDTSLVPGMRQGPLSEAHELARSFVLKSPPVQPNLSVVQSL